MAPSITIGAVILSWRKAAKKVTLSHAPSGTVPITLTPLGARPLSRAKFVLSAVSSINTIRAWSNIPCSRSQRRRARATSARCRSAACRLFFEGDVVAAKKPRKCTPAGSNPSLEQLRKRLFQGQVRPFGIQRQYPLCVRFQWRDASAARLRRGTPALVPALQPPHRRTRAHSDMFRCLSPRRPHFHVSDHAFPHVTRIRLRHCQPPHKRINARRLAHPLLFGNPRPIQIGREPL